jgi:hypothetical protein
MFHVKHWFSEPVSRVWRYPSYLTSGPLNAGGIKLLASFLHGLRLPPLTCDFDSNWRSSTRWARWREDWAPSHVLCSLGLDGGGALD